MKSSYRLVFVLSCAFVLGVLAGNGMSLQKTIAQGYEGLLAPGGEGAGGGGPGYYGVIPGPATDPSSPVYQEGPQVIRPEQETTRRKTVQQRRTPQQRLQSQQQRRTAGMSDEERRRARLRTLEDIQGLSLPRSVSKAEMKKIDDFFPASIKKSVQGLLSSRQKEFLDSYAEYGVRVDGMTHSEYDAKRDVEDILHVVALDDNLSYEMKKKRAVEARKKLRDMGYFYKSIADRPPEFNDFMGVPESYSKVEQKGATNTVQRIQAAINYVDNYTAQLERSGQ